MNEFSRGISIELKNLISFGSYVMSISIFEKIRSFEISYSFLERNSKLPILLGKTNLNLPLDRP